MFQNVLEMLEATEKQHPDKTAFSDIDGAYSFKELAARARAIGSSLAAKGCRNKPIAVLLDKSKECVCAFMGVVYSGNFYVVLDTAMPAERVNHILNTLSPEAILTDETHLEKTKSFDFSGDVFLYEKLCLGQPDEQLMAFIRRSAVDTDPLYALFTSGSTGVPKGAVINHRSVIDYAHWVAGTFDISSETVFGSQTPFYFSMSVLDVYTTMLTGATFHIIPKTLFSFPLKLIEFLDEKQINTVYWVPSALCIVANWKALDVKVPKTLKKVLFAGEVMPTKQLNQWIEKLPDALFANLYGPTEVTDICAYYIVDRSFRDDEALPIGNACANCGLMVLTADGREAKPGEEGELCVRGSFLAMGYYNNPEKTAEVFVQNPLNPYYPELVYKTGDLVKYNGRGELLYVSRKDFQIKHMGYRIELGEIETAVSAVPEIKHSVCVFDKERDKIVLIYQGQIEKKEILEQISVKLPDYMLPNRMVQVKAMPFNANGKIDRKWLKDNYRTLK